MEKEFVSYEQAVALKELGFDEMCFGFYSSPILELMHCNNSEPWMGNGVVTAPLKQQVLRWFREKYDLFGLVHRLEHMEEYYYMWVIERLCHSPDWKTYEEAENACIYKLIELAKQNNNEQSIV